MPLKPVRYIWMNGRFVRWEQARIHVLSHVVHYGSSWFEGIRAYATRRGTAIFRLHDHLRRLERSVRMYHAEMPYNEEELVQVCKEVVVRNGLQECYIRPIVYRGYGDLGVYPLNCPVEVAVAAWEWGAYLGAEAVQHGVDVGVSSWQRIASNTMPAMAKAGGNYMNSQLVRIEAARHGYAEGISLDILGMVSEGSGENIFLVIDGVLYTPPLSASILPGVTRHTVITFAREEGIPVVETVLPRGLLYTADEIFFTGTAAEITPVRSVDGVRIGSGKPGPLTRLMQERFYRIVREGEDPYGWLTFVTRRASARLGKLTMKESLTDARLQ
ncbi:MAG: branched-chain amino acid transaminase [Candidatus Kapabacteria bacterium]|nr:branched-chain amino acid transaminase [Candidatus Kapabacteria bacterium]MDW7996770.1 branched-chain amino acid transaminase [Bacteroidota bacterium]